VNDRTDVNNEAKQIQAKKVVWHSRRGMLELDVLLLPFAQQEYPSLPEEDQVSYQKLLEREDPDLFTWFMEHTTPDDPELIRIVNLVLEHARKPR